MNIVEIIISVIGAICVAAAGGFGIGHLRGTSRAEAKAEKQRAEEHAETTEAVAERRVEVTKEASNVQQTVNHLPDDDIDRELRESWKRPGGR